MTPEQRRLARHALGLPNLSRRSYRNRFAAYPGGPDHQAWVGMIQAGWAAQGPIFQGDALLFFHLTPAGAELALDHREVLCPEDFPGSPHAVPRDQGRQRRRG